MSHIGPIKWLWLYILFIISYLVFIVLNYNSFRVILVNYFPLVSINLYMVSELICLKNKVSIFQVEIISIDYLQKTNNVNKKIDFMILIPSYTLGFYEDSVNLEVKN